MVGRLVSVVPRTSFVLDDLVGVAPSILVRNLPLFAWEPVILVVRVEGNSLVAGTQQCVVRLVRTAPASEQPGDEFVEDPLVSVTLTSADAVGRARIVNVSKPRPYADMLVIPSCSAAMAAVGAIAISVDLLVRGRAFDRIVEADDERVAVP